jgi:hypothetical protein
MQLSFRSKARRYADLPGDLYSVRILFQPPVTVAMLHLVRTLLILRRSFLNGIVDRLNPLTSKTRGPAIVHAQRDAELLDACNAELNALVLDSQVRNSATVLPPAPLSEADSNPALSSALDLPW